MATIVDSYSESNRNTDDELGGDTGYVALGQAFAVTQTGAIGSCKFYLKKFGSPVGNMYARLYALTGTYGTNAKPTGVHLAESGAIDVSTLTTSSALVTFTFDADNQYDLVAGTKYGIAVEYREGYVDDETPPGSTPHYVQLGVDSTSPTHSGNTISKLNGIWSGGAGDYCFYVYYAEGQGLLPTYYSSVITAVARVQQDMDTPSFVIGGQGGSGGTTYALSKKSSTHVFSLWRSQVFNIGKDFDVLSVKFAVTPAITSNMSIIPVLYFDNSSSSSVGSTINSTNYTNSQKLITLTSKNFNNEIHGQKNFFLELQFTGSALAVVKLPISIDLEVETI